MKDFKNKPGVKIKHTNMTYVIYAILAIVMWIIGGWNTDNGDFSNYEQMYENDFLAMTLSTTPDYGFFLILELFKSFGFTLIQARIVIFFIFVLTLSYTIFKLCRKPVLALFLYFIVFYFRDVITLRNTVAMVFLLIGIVNLMQENIKYRKLKYTALVLLASSIHITFLFYLILLLKDVKINVKLYAIGAIILSFLGKPILEMLSSYLVADENGQTQAKIEGLLSSGSYVSLVICSITILLSVYMCMQSYKYLQEREGSMISFDVYKINVLMISLIILTSVSMSFIRLFYNVLLFDIIIMSNVISFKKKMDPVMLFWFIWIYLWAFWMSNVSVNFTKILSNNSLL